MHIQYIAVVFYLPTMEVRINVKAAYYASTAQQQQFQQREFTLRQGDCISIYSNSVRRTIQNQLATRQR